MANGWVSTHHLFSRLHYWAAIIIKVWRRLQSWGKYVLTILSYKDEIYKYCGIIQKLLNLNNKSYFNLKVVATCDVWGVMSLLQFKCEKFSGIDLALN